MRSVLGLGLTLVLGGCNALIGNRDFSSPTGDDDGNTPPDACLTCLADCASRGLPPTTITGTAYFPNGTMTLPNAIVYVPSHPPDALTDGVGPTPCISGEPIAVARTDAHGQFTLTGVPATPNLPLVIQIGKWRREITVPQVPECSETAIDPATTRLPATSAEGHIPRIAVVTGGAEALECVVRELGIADTEIGVAGTAARVHLYVNTVQGGTSAFDASFTGGARPFPGSLLLYDSLGTYDTIMLGCTGNFMDATADHSARLFGWVGAGGWLWLTHFEWDVFTTGPAPWPTIAQFSMDSQQETLMQANIDTSFAAGATFASWLLPQISSSTIPINNGRVSIPSIDTSQVQQWTFLDPALNANLTGIQSFSWSAPSGGRAVFSDMHVGISNQALAYPLECPTAIAAQDLAVMYETFDADTCVP